MDERLTAIFAAISGRELATVAAGVLGVDQVRLGTVAFDEISKPHADPRTIGIVRVSGTAAVNGEQRAWSSVTKLIDITVENTLGTPVDPRNEVLIYERGLFRAAGSRGMRPAHCYHISRPRDGLTILWLEDLTGAENPPFSIAALAEMAGHLGEWNARIAADPPELDFAIGNDFHIKSAGGFDFAARLKTLADLGDEPIVREMYAKQSLQVASDYVSAYLDLIERSKTFPHVLSLADCPVSNFFRLPGETIAIDLAGLGSEPVGADGGRFIGSALTWGRQFADVALRERELFEHYLTGLRSGGSTESRDMLRSGYLCELGFYLCTSALLPTILANTKATLTREYFEKRLDMPIEAMGSALARVIDLLPSYVEEVHSLLA